MTRSSGTQLHRSTAAAVWLLGALWCVGCSTIPKGQYGVKRIDWVGTKALDPHAIESCLVTRERQPVSFMLGVSAPGCGKPPFDSYPPEIDLWTMPWTDWPIFDPAIFDVERERIERWYHARGYYDAHVLSVKTFVGDKPVDPNECHGEGSECELKILVKLEEGAPTYVDRVDITSKTPLPPLLLEQLRKALIMRRGQRLDETDYDADKETLTNALVEASYARSTVTGHVTVDRNRRTAHVEYQIDPGPPCVFGTMTIEGAQDDVPVLLLIQAANIPRGAPYEQSVVDDAQRAIFGLNVFSSVRIERRGEGKVVDLVAIVQRGRVTRLSAGLGAMSGTMVRPGSSETNGVAQWDLHLSATYDNRSFLGGLRRLRLEERPRLIFLNQFPSVAGGPRPGNLIMGRFEQPATFERRTKLVATAGWDFGPDPFDGFFRHDIATKVGLERPFWKHRLYGRFAVAHDFYDVTESPPASLVIGPDADDDKIAEAAAVERQRKVFESVSSYRLPYLEQQLTVDLRDDTRRPRSGVYLSVLVQESSQLDGYASWDYMRVLPDLRAYVPLPFSMVLAARFALGALFVFGAADGLDAVSARVGPQAYRLRGGGANSNRGFTAGTLGDSQTGGTRRYEGSLELRVSLGEDFGFVLFGDIGNVSDTGLRTEGAKPAFEWRQLNTSAGFGLRYFSILGAIRLDLGWRLPGLQTWGGDNYVSEGWPSGAHLTIGEAF
ncbi:MAG: BamA/TamA family outer membrane protein [Polyangiales bacterium]